MTTQKQVRKSFWQVYKGLSGISTRKITYGDYKTHNTDTRCAFVDYVDMLCRDGEITVSLANRVTL